MSSLGRASAILGAGTMVSRITGLVRTIVLVGVIGSNASAAADAFAIANQLPNSVFNLISVGVLTAVIVPQIVRASSQADGGNAFISKLFTLGTVVLVAATAVAMLAAPWLVSLQLNHGNPAQLALATAFAYWCLPQILFYGLYALVGETLNARRIFGPFTWAPVANNIISIVGFLVIGAVFGENLVNVSDWTPDMVAWLGGTATAGIAVQAGILLLFWRKTGLALKVDFRWRGVGLGNVGRIASWTLLMALSSMAAGFYQNWVANAASGEGAAVTVMNNAWLIFMLPYSIIVHSIGTPYFTQLSEHAHAARDADVRADISRSIRTLGFFLTGALAAVVAAAVPASRVFTNSASDAVDAAIVLLCYLVGLLPLAVLFIVQRTFYAYGDTRTPFFFTLLQCALIAVTATVAGWLAASEVLPITLLAAAVALGQSIAGTVQTIVATLLLRRRLGVLDARRWMAALGRFLVAAVPAAAAGWGVFLLLGGEDGWTTADKILGVIGSGIIAVVVVIVYVAALALLRAPELQVARGIVKRFLPGR
ncbi:murein biosynthesis integral membrane protein MurJ [Microbacterium bovistercoris]|uniref:Murein biosynthesis integral membrane protein MurJ n=1 Tax=Microbacterium bovistercoris TaxID=2293570 RepID=A0A371NV32_9MICO|nr:murein biosynthesis integral membrane protein MurJ [Microbacterium bovistercoris]REJ06197.1 murein biosynthesis integral membrane protein MurJ [Microbacterium bovistercoris]